MMSKNPFFRKGCLAVGMLTMHVSKRVIALVFLSFLAIAIPLTLLVLQKQQDIRQRAAAEADLVVTGIQLTDAAGNVRTVFGVNEDIYVRVRLKNQGTATGVSPDGRTYTQVYSHKPTPATPGEVSPDKIYLKNGQFAAGYEKTYESRWNGLNNSYYQDAIYFNKANDGKYTARVYINYDGKVAESDPNNNQATITYTVTKNFISQGIYKDGTVQSTPPSGFTSDHCGSVNGVTACYKWGPANGKSIIKLTNTSSTSRTAGAGVYKSYYDFPDPYPSCTPAQCPDQFIWIWTQTIYSAKVVTLATGETTYVSLPIPACNWQVDAFFGSEIHLSFHPPSQTYGQQGRLIGGGWLEQYNGLVECKPDIPQFPSPTPTVTPSPTLPPEVPTPTITLTPSPTITETPTPIPPSETPTPTIPVCPLPTQVTNVRIECPFCGQ